MVIFGEETWNNYINMRDYLNTYPDKADEYARLKQTLAEKYPTDRVAYTDAKAEFIRETLKNAAEWRKENNSI